MSADDWPLLDPADEDALHLARLLSVDERPFQRITKRLLAKDALIHKFPAQLPTPPPDGLQEDEVALTTQPDSPDDSQERARYHDDILLDFAQLEATLIRIQFLLQANERERLRYAEEKSKILSTADAIRSNTAELRVQLTDAQANLALKQQYDELAQAIFKDKALKPRDALQSDNDKLRVEIEDLEQEGRDFGGLWTERRDRFARVVDEGRSLTRYIKGEKDDEPADDEELNPDGEGSEPKGGNSNAGTPLPESGGATPMHASMDGDEGAAAAAHQTSTQPAKSSGLRLAAVSDESREPSTVAPSLVGDGVDENMSDAIDASRATEAVTSEEVTAQQTPAVVVVDEAMDTT